MTPGRGYSVPGTREARHRFDRYPYSLRGENEAMVMQPRAVPFEHMIRAACEHLKGEVAHGIGSEFARMSKAVDACAASSQGVHADMDNLRTEVMNRLDQLTDASAARDSMTQRRASLRSGWPERPDRPVAAAEDCRNWTASTDIDTRVALLLARYLRDQTVFDSDGGTVRISGKAVKAV